MESTSDLPRRWPTPSPTFSTMSHKFQRDGGRGFVDVRRWWAGGQMSELRDAADNVDETIQDAQDQIDGVLKQASDVIVIAAGVMFGVTFFVFAAAFIGWWRLLILITVILSILMIVVRLVWGVVSIITVLVDIPLRWDYRRRPKPPTSAISSPAWTLRRPWRR